MIGTAGCPPSGYGLNATFARLTRSSKKDGKVIDAAIGAEIRAMLDKARATDDGSYIQKTERGRKMGRASEVENGHSKKILVVLLTILTENNPNFRF